MIADRSMPEGYEALREELNEIKDSSDIEYLYGVYFEDIDDIHSMRYAINAKSSKELQSDKPLSEIYTFMGKPVFELHPGDTLIEYSDGVTEATNRDYELFGNERLLKSLNKAPDASPEELLKSLRRDIDEFVGTALQFDDMTMLGIRFYGSDEK